MTDSRSDLVEITVDGRRYYGIPAELAAGVSLSIRERLLRVAKSVGADLPTDVPLWALALQLDVASKEAVRHASEPSLGSLAPVPPLSSHDVAQRTGYKPDAVRKAARRGTLHGEHHGRDWRFWPEDVDEWRPRRESA